MMFTILNRLRGTSKAYSKFIGMLLAYIIFSLTDNHYVALSVGVGYVIGECFKWGDAVGELTGTRNNLWKWRVWLFFRGLVWWVCLLPLMFIMDVYIVSIAIILLALAFPLACEIGYYTTKLFNFKYMANGWEHQEIWYGLAQDIVILSLLFML